MKHLLIICFYFFVGALHSEKIDMNKTGYIDLTHSRKIEMTLFAKFGNKIFGFIILLYIFLIFSFNKLRNE